MRATEQRIVLDATLDEGTWHDEPMQPIVVPLQLCPAMARAIDDLEGTRHV